MPQRWDGSGVGQCLVARGWGGEMLAARASSARVHTQAHTCTTACWPHHLIRCATRDPMQKTQREGNTFSTQTACGDHLNCGVWASCLTCARARTLMFRANHVRTMRDYTKWKPPPLPRGESYLCMHTACTCMPLVYEYCTHALLHDVDKLVIAMG